MHEIPFILTYWYDILEMSLMQHSRNDKPDSQKKQISQWLPEARTEGRVWLQTEVFQTLCALIVGGDYIIKCEFPSVEVIPKKTNKQKGWKRKQTKQKQLWHYFVNVHVKMRYLQSI